MSVLRSTSSTSINDLYTAIAKSCNKSCNSSPRKHDKSTLYLLPTTQYDTPMTPKTSCNDVRINTKHVNVSPNTPSSPRDCRRMMYIKNKRVHFKQ